MQRLARVKQLGHTYIVYPSAVHTRLEHSLGALYIAGRMCDQLGISDKEKAETFRRIMEDALVQHNSLGGRKKKTTAGSTRTFGG